MRSKDFVFFAAWAAILFALLSPAWFRPGWSLANFGDLYAYHYPLRHLALSSLQSGRLPFWNPYIFAGLPLAANPQSALFYPLTLLGAIFPLNFAFTWESLFHLSWAALGVMLLARRGGLPSCWAFLLAVLYALSPFLVYRITEGIPTLLASLSWAPWCWLAWLSGRRGLLAGVWALQFFSGHPQFTAINAMGMAAWALFQRGKALRALGRLAVEGFAALMLTAVQWYPTGEFLGRSVRQGWPEAFMTAYSLDWRSLLTWLHPDAWGNPVERTFAGPPSVFFETSAVYVGILGFVLAAAGLRLGKSRKAATALIFLGVFFALGGNNPLYRLMLRTPLGFLRTPARYLFLSFWGLLLAAGAGLRRLEPALRPAPLLRGLVVAAALAELMHWDVRFLSSEDSWPYLRPNPSVAQAAGGAPLRIMTDPEFANPDKAMLYRAMNVNGYEAFFLADFPAYAARSEGRAAADPSRSYLSRCDSPEMNRLGVAYYLSKEGRLAANPKAGPLAYFVDDREAPVEGEASLTIERPERWLVKARRPRGSDKMVLAQSFYPGWRARIDGSPAALEKWDGLIQGVELPRSLEEGRSFELILDFSPTGWPIWAALSLLAWLVWLSACPALLSSPA